MNRLSSSAVAIAISLLAAVCWSNARAADRSSSPQPPADQAASAQASARRHNPADDWVENYAYTLGVQAYIFGYPYVFLSELRHAWVTVPPPNKMTPYAPVNHFFHFPRLADASYRGGGGANNDTLYSPAWIDLSKEPLILSHPDMGDRYFWFQLVSMDDDNFGAIGKRTTGGKAGSFALVGPDWHGKLPRGLKGVRRSRTNHAFILGRTLVYGPDDTPNVNKLQAQYSLVPLSLWGKKDAVLPASREVMKPFDRKVDPLADWKTMNQVMTENPPEARLSPLLNMFKAIGVGPGQDVEKMDELTKRALARAAVDGRKMLLDINHSSHPFIWRSVNGWDISAPTYGAPGLADDFIRRAAISYSGVCSSENAEATYYESNTDAKGEPFDGSIPYTLTFGPGELPHVTAFWSVTVSDTSTNNVYNLVPNPINRYSIGDRTKGLKPNADGGFTIYLQSTSPGSEKESNWLPTPAGRLFTLTFRTYMPKEDIIEQRWFPPAVQPAAM